MIPDEELRLRSVSEITLAALDDLRREKKETLFDALTTLVELARQERNWCDNNGRGSKAEAWERIALAVEKATLVQT